MARILVQSNTGRTVLDERGVDPGALEVEAEAVDLIERLQTAIEAADRPPRRRRRRVSHERPRLRAVESGFGRTFD